MGKFLSRFFNGHVPGRMPVLVASLVIGALLISGGARMRVQQSEAVEVAMAATQTALAPTLTPSVTSTATETPLPTDTPTITLTPSHTPTGTLPPTDTPAPTNTASPTPVPAGQVAVIVPTVPADGTLPADIAPQMPAIGVPRGVENILLLGRDYRPELDDGHNTDTIIVVSINKTEGTVNMLSLPRDMYVWVPNWGMAKINTVYPHGEATGFQGGGAGLLKATLLYNFGITVHHYALVNMGDFREIVDVIGGIDVPVDCNYRGFRLKQPAKSRDDFGSDEEWVDYTDPENGNYEVFTLPIGVHHFDGYMALWYSRFRQGGSDFGNASRLGRVERQQQVLRQILRTARAQGLLNVTRIPDLWTQYNELVTTDMGLGNMLQLLPIGAEIDTNEIGTFGISDMFIGYDGQHGGGFILDPAQIESIQSRITAAMGPPTQTLLQRQIPVEIRNGTSHEALDVIAEQQINQRGISVVTIPVGETTAADQTIILDYTGQQKSNQLLLLQRLLSVPDVNVKLQPDPNRTVDYVIILGKDYYNKVNECLQEDANAVGAATPMP